MNRLLSDVARWVGAALLETIKTETTTTQGRANLVIFAFLFLAFIIVFAAPTVIVEIIRLILDREPNHVGVWSTLLAFLAVCAVGLASVWMLKTEAFSGWN